MLRRLALATVLTTGVAGAGWAQEAREPAAPPPAPTMQHGVMMSGGCPMMQRIAAMDARLRKLEGQPETARP